MDTTKMQCDLLAVEGARNVRDLGGYTTKDGLILQKRRFIRSGSLWDITPAGIQALSTLGIVCIVDLRSQYEVEIMPDSFCNGQGMGYHHVPMLDHIQSNSAQGLLVFPNSMIEMYVGLLENDKQKFKRVFEIFAQPHSGTVLFHCTAGKDRTGITAMLLLQLMGVDDQTIIQDYSWSDKLLEPPNLEDTPFPRYVFESRPETMEATLEYVYREYGSAQQYLESIGVNNQQRETIRNKLLA